MGRMQLPPDFRDFLRLLNDHQVEYLLLGGYAVTYHGYPRTTLDMDIWIGTSAENSDRMVLVMRDFGFTGPVSPQIFRKDDGVVRLGVPPMKLEIMIQATFLGTCGVSQCRGQRAAETEACWRASATSRPRP